MSSIIGPIQSFWGQTFDDGLVPKVLELVLFVWDKMAKPQSTAGELEITKDLYCQLNDEAEVRNLPLRIDLETPLVDPKTKTEVGRLDLRFTDNKSMSREAYFAIECKRLYAIILPTKPTKKPAPAKPPPKPRALTGQYVQQGMIRFVIPGKYSPTAKHGAMLGYVLAAKRAVAEKGINRSIKRHASKLGLATPGKTSLSQSKLISDSRAWYTLHSRSAGSFELHHLIVD